MVYQYLRSIIFKIFSNHFLIDPLKGVQSLATVHQVYYT